MRGTWGEKAIAMLACAVNKPQKSGKLNLWRTKLIEKLTNVR
jgi:hypothetical protein